jgi:glutamate/tyrosine decarboxylase-like PLP-dependent enzyme
MIPNENAPQEPEETLDPQDWEATRALAHRMVDDMLDYTQTLRERPPWVHLPDAVKATRRAPLPREPHPLDEVYDEFREQILPYPIGNIHPRFWGWVLGTGTVTGALAEFLSAVMNTNTGGIDNHAANHVERVVLDWIKEMLGYPAEASGVLTSGGSAANLIGLTVARNAAALGVAACDVRVQGVQACPRPLAFYASEEAHSSVERGIILLGLGSGSLHKIPCDDAFRMDIAALEAAIARDRAEGWAPACVVGCAGTTNTGAFDDLRALADICEREGLWFHVDGAFGAWAALAPEGRVLVAGMERADSLALDLHKWMYLPYEIGCTLVRDHAAHRDAFSLTPAYLAHGGTTDGRGLAGGDLPWFSDYTFQLSRGFRALKAWMSLKEQGADRYARLVAQNMAQARYLAELVEADAELELLAPVPLNVVCYRYSRPGLDDGALDALNARILVELQERGIAVPSSSVVRGRYCLHVAITNHRTRREDLALLARETVRLGRELSQA